MRTLQTGNARLSVVSHETQGYFSVKGMGLDFQANVVIDPLGIDNYIECSNIKVPGDERQLGLVLAIGQAKTMSCDLLETLIVLGLVRFLGPA